MLQQGYRIFGLFEDGEMLAIAGVTIATDYAFLRHLWLHDLVVQEGHRSRGLGRQLLEYVHDFARQQGCERVILETGPRRVDTIRFYTEKMGYQQGSVIFEKDL